MKITKSQLKQIIKEELESSSLFAETTVPTELKDFQDATKKAIELLKSMQEEEFDKTVQQAQKSGRPGQTHNTIDFKKYSMWKDQHAQLIQSLETNLQQLGTAGDPLGETRDLGRSAAHPGGTVDAFGRPSGVDARARALAADYYERHKHDDYHKQQGRLKWRVNSKLSELMKVLSSLIIKSKGRYISPELRKLILSYAESLHGKVQFSGKMDPADRGALYAFAGGSPDWIGPLSRLKSLANR